MNRFASALMKRSRFLGPDGQLESAVALDRTFDRVSQEFKLVDSKEPSDWSRHLLSRAPAGTDDAVKVELSRSASSKRVALDCAAVKHSPSCAFHLPA